MPYYAPNMTISEVSIAFTDGDTMRRTTVTDTSVVSTSKIVGNIRRPDSTDDSADTGYVYIHSIVLVSNGSFDVLIVCKDWGYDDPVENIPNETIKFYYSVV